MALMELPRLLLGYKGRRGTGTGGENCSPKLDLLDNNAHKEAA